MLRTQFQARTGILRCASARCSFIFVIRWLLKQFEKYFYGRHFLSAFHIYLEYFGRVILIVYILCVEHPPVSLYAVMTEVVVGFIPARRKLNEFEVTRMLGMFSVSLYS
jgi:hypothetical protein